MAFYSRDCHGVLLPARELHGRYLLKLFQVRSRSVGRGICRPYSAVAAGARFLGRDLVNRKPRSRRGGVGASTGHGDQGVTASTTGEDQASSCARHPCRGGLGRGPSHRWRLRHREHRQGSHLLVVLGLWFTAAPWFLVAIVPACMRFQCSDDVPSYSIPLTMN
jgi:hypothetical protein